MQEMIPILAVIAIIFIAPFFFLIIDFLLANWLVGIVLLALLVASYFLYVYIFSKGGGNAQIINGAP